MAVFNTLATCAAAKRLVVRGPASLEQKPACVLRVRVSQAGEFSTSGRVKALAYRYERCKTLSYHVSKRWGLPVASLVLVGE